MSTLGAFIGLILSILLIIRKINPVYSLITGGIVGGLLGGLSFVDTVEIMAQGVKDVSPVVLRILTAGVLSGVLLETGAAKVISNSIILKMGIKRVFLSLAMATFLLCSIGVFIDVAVITVAPISLMIYRQTKLPISAFLISMIGGGKSGNIISPNPNTIVVAENFNVDLSSIMLYGIIPSFLGIVVTVVVAKWLARKTVVEKNSMLMIVDDNGNQPSLWSSLCAPIVTIILLALRPLLGIMIDPLIALPVGGLIGFLVMRKKCSIATVLNFGLQKMSSVAILLIGTGAIAGVIVHSNVTDIFLSFLDSLNSNAIFLAPLSGALMSAATASTTAGAMIASASFAEVIMESGISKIGGALLLNAGCTVFDHLPHGSFFHTTGGVCELSFRARLKLIPYETLIGISLSVSVTLFYYVLSIL